MAGDSNRLLEVYLEERRGPCPKCGYDLFGLKFQGERPRCPECGLPLRLTARLERGYGEPRGPTRRMRRAESIILTIVAVIFGGIVLAAFAAYFMR